MRVAGRFPLLPGRPLVFRRENGAWGYSCVCTRRGNSSDRYNADDWAQALRDAISHVRFFHEPTTVESAPYVPPPVTDAYVRTEFNRLWWNYSGATAPDPQEQP